jgi:uncharacterized protein with NRDE domain
MCTLFLAINKHQKYPVILLENRDEFYSRKSDLPHKWKACDLFAGKDHEKGGTWLGYNSLGNWGVVTNYRDLTKNLGGNLSRGELIPKIIGAHFSLEKAINFLQKNAEKFGPFNLVFSIGGMTYYFSSIKKEPQLLEEGIFGLSNAFLDTPWYKVEKGKKKFSEIISSPILDRKALFQLMKDEEKAPENTLPSTGLPKNLEKLVSSLFISSENYGTHCTSLLLKNKEGKIDFKELRTK